jgi:predicted nucleotidyltransferase
MKGLFTKTRSRILTLLFGHPDEWYYNRQIKEAVGVGNGAVQRELSSLLRSEIIEREERGNQVYYRANRKNPIFPELHMLILKTIGLGDCLRRILDPFSNRIDFAYIYGSVASGAMKSDSDIDIMIAGDVSRKALATPLAKAQRELSREINASFYHLDEYLEKLKENDSFISRVHSGPKITLLGDPDGLE